VAWPDWQPVAFSEIEPFPCAVLRHHYPTVPNWGDMEKFKEWPDAAIDVLVGGTPCQSFSVAGLRAGLADPRGNLALVYLAIAERYRPEWLVWENVPGVLSADGGRAFGAFLGGLAVLGYGFAYRVLDAQYAGLAQRRKRVFVVGHLGDWRRAAAVLFESASLRGDPAPSRETREGVANSLTRGADSSGKGGYAGRRREDDVNIIANPLPGHHPRTDLDNDTHVVHSLRAEDFDASEDGTGRGIPMIVGALSDGAHMGGGLTARTPIAGELSRCLNAGGMGRIDYETETLIPVGGGFDVIAFSAKDHGADAGPLSPTLRAGGFDKSHANSGNWPAVAFQESEYGTQEYDIAGTQRADRPDHTNNLRQGMQVRRLTPKECARLQGFPDTYLDITYRGKPAADGPKYKALGNSMAVPVMAWIGKRIQMVSEL